MSSAALPSGAVAQDPLHRRAQLLREALAPEAGVLLGTSEPELFARRLLRLRVDVTDDEDREALQERIDALLPRVSWQEALARLALSVAVACWCAVALWPVACFLAGQVAPHTLELLRLAGHDALGWPVAPAAVRRMALLGLAAVLLTQLALWLRARDALRRARVALRETARTAPEVWPGIPADAPFTARAHLWAHPGTIAVLLATAILGRQLGGHPVGPAWLLLALLLGLAGAGAMVVAHRIRRVDELASRALFVGRI